MITVTTPLMVRLEGVLNDQNLVERIDTWIANPVLGDMKLEAIFSDYKDFGGVKFPTHILQRSAGYPVLDLTITGVTPNAAVALEVPASIRQPAAPAAALVPEKVSEGLWIVPGNAKSIAVEFRDHVVMVDAPETRDAIDGRHGCRPEDDPGKPIRYVINTHSHFDHAGGLRTYAADGATIVTQAGNIPYYQQVWSNPRTIAPDRLARSGRTPVFEGIVGSRTFRDDVREMVVYHYAGNMHNAGMLMVFLPKERMLIEADSFTPANNPNDPPGAVANLVHFLDAVDRLRLDVQQILPIHGRVTALEDARAARKRSGGPRCSGSVALMRAGDAAGPSDEHRRVAGIGAEHQRLQIGAGAKGQLNILHVFPVIVEFTSVMPTPLSATSPDLAFWLLTTLA